MNNPNGWAPFNDPLLASSNIDIAANYWTAAARLGLISYAMLPLAITLAVKQVSAAGTASSAIGADSSSARRSGPSTSGQALSSRTTTLTR